MSFEKSHTENTAENSFNQYGENMEQILIDTVVSAAKSSEEDLRKVIKDVLNAQNVIQGVILGNQGSMEVISGLQEDIINPMIEQYGLDKDSFSVEHLASLAENYDNETTPHLNENEYLIDKE